MPTGSRNAVVPDKVSGTVRDHQPLISRLSEPVGRRRRRAARFRRGAAHFLPLIGAALIFGQGCATPVGRETEPAATAADPAEEPLDFGDDWATIGITWMPGEQAPGVAAAPSTGSAPAGGNAAAAADAGWTIILQTFTGQGHQAVAELRRRQVAPLDPRLASARVLTDERGSMLVLGRFEGPTDPAARAALEWARGLTANGQRIFPRVMLSRPKAGGGQQQSRYALVDARKQYPNVDPLYTLQVAVWGVFGGRMTWDEVRRRAEADVVALRARGLRAFVHHDHDRQLSMVTVGLFDRNAINPTSGLLSDEIERLRRDFPAHLVNGEPVEEPLDSRHPGRGSRVQVPMLVEVPR